MKLEKSVLKGVNLYIYSDISLLCEFAHFTAFINIATIDPLRTL
jgi:hypothetical protein